MGSISSHGTKSPHATGQISPHTATTEPMSHDQREVHEPLQRTHMPQQTPGHSQISKLIFL